MIAEAPPHRKHEILDAACRVIARDGVAALRVADVAREAGVSTALVHYYCDSRTRLVEEAFTRVDELADAAATADFAKAGSARGRLEHLLLAWSGADPTIRASWAVWCELWQYAIRNEWARARVTESHQRWLDQIATLLEEGRSDGSLPRAIDGPAAARRLAACVDDWGREMLVGMRGSEEVQAALLDAVALEVAAAGRAA